MPPMQGKGRGAPHFGGSLLFLHTPIDAELPNLTWYHLWGGGLFLGVSHGPVRKERSSSVQKFLGFSSFYDYTL